MLKAISVVIPICNEMQSLELLISRLHQVLENGADFELLFVDDGSTDGSLALLQQIQRSTPQVSIVELSRNHGQTAALAAGIAHAQHPIIVTMDGDLQHSPSDIPLLLAALENGCDMAIGWRKVRTDGFFLRRIPSKIANALMRHVSGLNIKDFGTAFRAADAELLKSLELFGELHRFVPVLAAKKGAHIVEVPITVHPRTAGESKYGLTRTFGVIQDLLFLEFYLNYLTKPMRAFGKIAFICLATGFLISTILLVLVLWGTIPSVLEHEGLLIFSVFLMIVGVQLLGTGILAELLARILHTSAGTPIFSVKHVHRLQSEG